MPFVCRPASRRPAPRRGNAIVEAALVLPIFVMFVFGIYEYGRYLLVLNVTTNAARDAARWAAVHANDQRAADATVAGVPTANYTIFSRSSDPRLTGTYTPKSYRGAPYGATRPAYTVGYVSDYATTRMGPVAGMLENRAVWVFAADTAQLYANPAMVLPKENTTSWREATFTERIAVQIVGDYRPILPTFLFMDDPVRVSVIGLATSEG